MLIRHVDTLDALPHLMHVSVGVVVCVRMVRRRIVAAAAAPRRRHEQEKRERERRRHGKVRAGLDGDGGPVEVEFLLGVDGVLLVCVSHHRDEQIDE